MNKDGKQALKVGDRICVVDATMTMGEYENGNEQWLIGLEAEKAVDTAMQANRE